MMTTGAMLWQAALYNNGGAPYKNARYGESYAADGTPQRLQAFPAADGGRNENKGLAAVLEPLPRWEVTQPGNVLRVFERGGIRSSEIGNPTRNEEPGRPDAKLSDRGFGTLLRTDPVFLGLQKTRLLDPLLSFPGTNDQPGRLPHQRLHGLPCRLRQRSRTGALRTVRAVRQRRPDARPSIRRSIPSVTSPGIRSGTPSRVRFRPASA